jgi:hypothetical protein
MNDVDILHIQAEFIMIIEGHEELSLELLFYDIIRRIVLGHRHTIADLLRPYHNIFTMDNCNSENEDKFSSRPPANMAQCLMSSEFKKKSCDF